MRWSWRIGRVFGIAISVHVTFLILLGWIAVSSYLRLGRIADAVAGLALTLSVFASVIAHELGHALVARRVGVGTRDITLLPIGGVARLDRMPRRPAHELAIAIAGPAVSLFLAGLLAAIAPAALSPTEPNATLPLPAELARINLGLALFNLLPAFPMDGGRMLRAILSMRGDRVRATRIAATIGQGLAMLLGAVGLFVNPMLVFIALFVWIGAASEAGAVQTEALLEGVPVRLAMMTEFLTLAPGDDLGRAAQVLLRGSQTDFPVLAPGGEVVGILTRDGLIRGLTADGPGGSVAGWMTKDFCQAEAESPLSALAERIQAGRCTAVPVTHQGGLCGLVTLENIGELLLLRGAVPAWRQSAEARSTG